MSLRTSAFLTALMSVLQMIVQFGDMMPPKYKVVALGAQVALEATKSFVTHFSNPDGKPSSEPYVKPE